MSLVIGVNIGTTEASAGLQRLGKRSAKQAKGCPGCVEIVFDGLFFFAFPDGDTAKPEKRSECKVGVVSSRDDHHLVIELVEVVENTEVTSIIELPHAALQTLPRDIYLIKRPEPTDPDVTIKDDPLHPGVPKIGWGKPYKRTQNPGRCPGDECAFNWIMDFEGRELHGRGLSEKRDTLRPKLHIKTGLFFTKEISEYPFLKLKDGKLEEYGYVAKKIGVKINVSGSDELVLKLDTDWEYPISRNVKTITLKNEPPKPQQTQAVHRDPYNDHVQIYYDDLFDLPRRDRFVFIPIMDGRKASEPFVCYGGGGGVWP
jgi:hypothetical protein